MSTARIGRRNSLPGGAGWAVCVLFLCVGAFAGSTDPAGVAIVGEESPAALATLTLGRSATTWGSTRWSIRRSTAWLRPRDDRRKGSASPASTASIPRPDRMISSAIRDVAGTTTSATSRSRRRLPPGAGGHPFIHPRTGAQFTRSGCAACAASARVASAICGAVTPIISSCWSRVACSMNASGNPRVSRRSPWSLPSRW